MSGYLLNMYTMHKVARILLDIAAIGWMVFVIVAIVAVITN